MPIIELEIIVEDIDQIVRLYDRLQFFRSPDETGSPTPFTPITTIEPLPATVDGTVTGPWNLNGKALSIIIDGADPITVAFTSSIPVNLQSLIININTVFPTLASEVPSNTNRLRLTSPTTGTQSIIQVSGSALTTIGLTALRTNGKSPSPLLSINTEIYRLTDFDGQPTFWYKARYLNSVTGAASDVSSPFLGAGGEGLPTSTTSVGKIALADITGKPLTDRRIIVVPVSSQIISDGIGNNYGVLPSVDRIVVITDSNGRATISLIIGQRVKVFIEGTTFQREFVVPTNDFDILTVASSQPDPLSIVVASPIPIRVS